MGLSAVSCVVWAPEEVPVAKDELPSWSYVVLEEIVAGVAVLRRWGWPVVDQLGRLLWPDGGEHHTQGVTVDVGMLRAQLYTPNHMLREPRCGDVFAVLAEADAKWRSGRHCDDVRELMPEPVFDISAVARQAAKIAYESSLGAVTTVGAADISVRAAVRTAMAHRRDSQLTVLQVAPPPSRGTAGGVR